MVKKQLFVACLVACTSIFPAKAAAPDTGAVVALAAAGACAAGWLASRYTVGPACVNIASRRYGPELAALNNYGVWAQNGYGWNAAYEQQLREQIKNYAVQFHNVNRDKWGLTVFFEQAQGLPSGYVPQRYYYFPLLFYMKELEQTILSLRIISALRIYSDRDYLWTLLQQLMYIRDLMRSDLQLNQEGQMFVLYQAQQPQQVVNNVVQNNP